MAAEWCTVACSASSVPALLEPPLPSSESLPRKMGIPPGGQGECSNLTIRDMGVEEALDAECERYWETYSGLWVVPFTILDVRVAANSEELVDDGREIKQLLDDGAVRRRYRGLTVEKLRPRWREAAQKRAKIVTDGGDAAWAAELARCDSALADELLTGPNSRKTCHRWPS